MSLTTINLSAMAKCSSIFNECKLAEDSLNRELRPVEEAIHNMAEKVSNAVDRASNPAVPHMKKIQSVMIITIAVDTCSEKILKLEQTLSVIKSQSAKLIAIQNLDISAEVLQLIVNTCANINMICDNIREDMLETATTRSLYVRARNTVRAKLGGA